MCQPGQDPGSGPGVKPGGVDEALGMLDRALAVLARADPASLPTETQAQVLRGLEHAESRHTAARASFLAAFSAQAGPEADGQGSARAWLRWQTRITRGAAAGAVGWARRLAAHPAIAGALAQGGLSASWARQVCDWTDRIPPGRRDEADQILVTAADGGADLSDLAALAGEIYQRCAPPADGDGDGFEDRYLHLETTLDGAGRLGGDLTPGATSALSAVLGALGKRAGPEDTRTAAQRRHDALHEACRRLMAAGMVPGRAGQPTRVQVQMTLGQLRNLPGAEQAEKAWAEGQACPGGHGPGRLAGAEAEAAACDATVIPVVTGHPDPAAVDRLTQAFHATDAPGRSRTSDSPGGSGCGGSGCGGSGCGGSGCGGSGCGDRACPRPRPLTPAARRRLRSALLGLAAGTLSGPDGLAARLRARLDYGPLASPSLPLDIGAATDIIPAHLRRAAILRHPHCGFAGCRQPASACDIHHVIPRSRGGPTALRNLIPLCGFHHLVVIHRWGWSIRLNPDGTTTATSPDGTRVYQSHDPPANAA